MTQPTGDYTTLVPVTGEAVALDLRLAQFPSRMLALALDLLVQVVVLLVVFFFAANVVGLLDSAAGAAVTLVAVVSVIVIYPTILETATRGRSLGKLAAGLRVVRDDGGPVRFRHSFVRALFMIVDFWATSGSVGLISSLLSSRAKRLGDHFAGTVVVRDRVTRAATYASPSYGMPAGLEPWAAQLDLSRLPDVTAGQARALLSRASTLAPASRQSLGMQLAAEVSSYVTPPPPPGLHPETYLAAVLTVRMRRASEQAQARAARSVPMPPPLPTPPPTPPVRPVAQPPQDGPPGAPTWVTPPPPADGFAHPD